VAAVVDDPQKQLAWEARHRPRAGVAAVLATLGMIGWLWGNLRLGTDAPTPSGLQTLQRALAPGPVDALPSLQIARFQYYLDHQAAVILYGVVGMIGSVATGWALGFLAVATRARRPEIGRWVVYLPIVGGVLAGLYTFLGVIGEITRDRDFLDGPRTVAAAAESTGLLTFVQYLGLFSVLATAGAYLLVSLNARRVGLITKLFGIVGITTGVFVVVPIIPLFAPLLQIMFLASLALLFFGAWAGAIPPAWNTGRAEPWPTRQQQLEARAEPGA
jgi:hypothetical protein